MLSLRMVLAAALAGLFAAANGWCGDPTLAWRYPTGGQFRSIPAVGPDGTLYAASDDQYLYAIAPDGTVNWRSSLGWLPADCLAIGEDGTIYVGLQNDELVAVNPSGHQIWKFDAGAPIVGNPAVAPDGTIFIANDTGTLVALSLRGAVEWQLTLPAKCTLDPLLSGSETLYLGGADRRLYALTRWGSFRWSLPLDSAPAEAAVDADGSLFVMTEGGRLDHVDSQGDILWSKGVGPGAPSEVLIGKQGVLAATVDGVVRELDRSGLEVWRTSIGPAGRGSMVIGNGIVYALTADGVLHLLGQGGSTSGAVRVGSAGTVVASPAGGLIIGGRDWVVYAYAGVHESIDAPWGQPSGGARHSRLGGSAARTAGTAPLEVPDYLYFSTQLDLSSRSALMALLSESGRRIARGSAGKSTWYLERVVDTIVGVGLLSPIITGNTIVNDYPDVRASAADQLAKIGSLASRSILIRLLHYELEPTALSAEISALGAIGSDSDGAATRAIAAALRRSARFSADNGVGRAAVEALAAIAQYSGGMPDPSGTAALGFIYRGSYSPAVRATALEALERLAAM
ncbi:MAG TPA: PQQ-binding-like beta-propeller repeat protein [Spirochaetia bacterium]|nr:PQQ-binding-like beta-propeller repeat protein [Spirochaetia bacterium]